MNYWENLHWCGRKKRVGGHRRRIGTKTAGKQTTDQSKDRDSCTPATANNNGDVQWRNRRRHGNAWRHRLCPPGACSSPAQRVLSDKQRLKDAADRHGRAALGRTDRPGQEGFRRVSRWRPPTWLRRTTTHYEREDTSSEVFLEKVLTPRLIGNYSDPFIKIFQSV